MCIFLVSLMCTSGQTHLKSLSTTALGGLPANTVPGRDSDKLNGILGSYVILFIFILRGTGLLGSSGRCCRHLCLLGGLLHLQPFLLSEFCLLLSRLHKHMRGMRQAKVNEDYIRQLEKLMVVISDV